MELNLNHIIDQVSKDNGIQQEALQETLEQAILQAAKKVFGVERDIEVQFHPADGVVELFQIIRVTDDIEDPYNELTLDEAEEHGLDAELGDELLFQIFYLPQDAGKAKEQRGQWERRKAVALWSLVIWWRPINSTPPQATAHSLVSEQ